jgi:uncharacterized Zn-binding protein involved in type VI secretion
VSLQRVARLGDHCDHGGVIITGSDTRTVDGIKCARVTDLYSCPIPGHGVNPIVTGSAIATVDGLKVARVTDTTQCGAMIVEGSPTWSSE